MSKKQIPEELEKISNKDYQAWGGQEALYDLKANLNKCIKDIVVEWKAGKKWVVDKNPPFDVKPLPKPNFIDRFRFRLWKRHQKFLEEALEKMSGN